jgi:hypothetical protein
MKRKWLAIDIILLFVGIACSPGINATINDTPEQIETSDDDYSFFSFAIIWGEFEILNEKHILRGLDVYNPYPYNKTLHAIAYVGYDGVGFIYKNASRIYCPWWLGFVSQHRLFVIGWGNSVQVY